jgi:hypothetical protein
MISPQTISEVLNKHSIRINGVLHIGAYECEELVHYSYLDIPRENIIWIEALQEKVDEAKRKGIPNVYQAVISDKDNESIEFNIADNGQSSSMLKPKMHLIHHPHIHFIKKNPLISTKLDTFWVRNNLDPSKYDFWNFDIQGAEMLALRGGLNTLINHPPKAIYLEVNTEEIYKDCSLLEELDEFLLALGYKRESILMTEYGWGDALYIKESINSIEPITPQPMEPQPLAKPESAGAGSSQRAQSAQCEEPRAFALARGLCVSPLIKIYYVKDWWHPKNIEGLQLLRYNNIQVKEWNNENDGIIFSPTIRPDIIEHYKKVITGPHMDFRKMITLSKIYNGKKIYYNTLSKWCKKLHESNASNENIEYITLPFPVNVNKFISSEKQNKCFIYFKHVHSSRGVKMMNCLNGSDLNMECKIFTYGNYKEEEYLEWLKKAKFGIWVGHHESQGFAFQHALSCDCPLFVYDVSSLNDECISDSIYPWADFHGEFSVATSASYFDERCGIIYKDGDNLQEKFNSFIENLSIFRPREFVIENLSVHKFISRIKQLFP